MGTTGVQSHAIGVDNIALGIFRNLPNILMAVTSTNNYSSYGIACAQCNHRLIAPN